MVYIKQAYFNSVHLKLVYLTAVLKDWIIQIKIQTKFSMKAFVKMKRKTTVFRRLLANMEQLLFFDFKRKKLHVQETFKSIIKRITKNLKQCSN